ncbi:DNA polymerase IV, partial [Halomonas sp. MG34]|nr:DNA polymerase IV [Halomonas sp. MG34]
MKLTANNPHKGRVIFHIDMNCFYASVEAAYNPDLKGKALAIAGNPEERKGIVVTSSYEARAKGVKTTMTIWQAKRNCPELIVMRPNFERYRAASKALFRILSEITPDVQPVSIDEGYMDITHVTSDLTPLQIADSLQKRVLDELDLPCSIGIAPNKFLAKMASDMKKPLGITVLRKRELASTLWPLPIGEMYGVGEKTATKLIEKGIKTR